jgi:hypothetical protein
MTKDSISWNELTKLTQGESFEVERVRLARTGVAIEGLFELPALVQMSTEDQVFISAFLRSHGSIKEMESLFGISYPTVKARLTRIAEQLPFVETIVTSTAKKPAEDLSRSKILDQLASGKISTDKALKLLREKELK